MSVDIATKKLLEALRAEDEAIVQLGEVLEAARANFRVGAIKYAALRDEMMEIVSDIYEDKDTTKLFASKGKYQFLRMPVGDAVRQVLRAADQSVDMRFIFARLLQGGSEIVDSRPINAALMTMVRTGEAARMEAKGENDMDRFELVEEEAPEPVEQS